MRDGVLSSIYSKKDEPAFLSEAKTETRISRTALWLANGSCTIGHHALHVGCAKDRLFSNCARNA